MFSLVGNDGVIHFQSTWVAAHYQKERTGQMTMAVNEGKQSLAHLRSSSTRRFGETFDCVRAAASHYRRAENEFFTFGDEKRDVR